MGRTFAAGRSGSSAKMERRRLTVSPGFPVLVCLLVCLSGLRGVLPFLLAAALHEAGHLLALALLGIPVYGLELRASGAVIRAELRGELREAWALLAGPAVNLLVAGGLFHLRPLLSFCSLALGLFNLLPIRGLDGGRLCALLLPRLLGPAGSILCKLLHCGTLLALAAAGIWGTCVLYLGLLPALLAGFFLLRLPNVLDKSAAGW